MGTVARTVAEWTMATRWPKERMMANRSTKTAEWTGTLLGVTDGDAL